ncbi:hypothetical protein D9M72_158820 [compost metagenome]
MGICWEWELFPLYPDQYRPKPGVRPHARRHGRVFVVGRAPTATKPARRATRRKGPRPRRKPAPAQAWRPPRSPSDRTTLPPHPSTPPPSTRLAAARRLRQARTHCCPPCGPWPRWRSGLDRFGREGIAGPGRARGRCRRTRGFG